MDCMIATVIHRPPLACHASWGRGILPPLPIGVRLGHVTCFGQWNVSGDDVSSVRADTSRGAVSFCLRPFPLMRMAGLRWGLLFNLVPGIKRKSEAGHGMAREWETSLSR